MDIWDEYLFQEDVHSQVESMIDAAGYVFFFKFGKELFGTGEDNRIIFARMKNPDKDMPKNWEEDASFSADNLNKNIKGQPGTQVFHKTDVDKVKIVDRDKVVAALQKVAEKEGGVAPKKNFSIDLMKIFHHDPDTPPNFVRSDEE